MRLAVSVRLFGSSCKRPAGCQFFRSSLPLAAWLLVLGLPGCAELRHANSAAYVTRGVRGNDESNELVAFKAWVLYPGRDILTLDWLRRWLLGDEAWNADTDWSGGTSFCEPRSAEDLTPQRVALGPCTNPPRPPFRVLKRRRGVSPGSFIGSDASGRRFLFKLDDPRYPELGSSVAIIASRILWALGYRVPPVYLVRVEGTGDERLDGQRATATLYLDNVRGHFRFDWFRYRREARALRIACAWINDVDRGGRNNLVIWDGQRALYYLIDFNSCLGAWQGRPKESWRGWQHEGDPLWALLRLISLGQWHAEPDPRQRIVSPAVGRFDSCLAPLRWRPQSPNTAFDRLTAADLEWIVERIRRLDRPQIEAIVSAAQLSDPADAQYLVDALLARRQRILETSAPR